jgi:1,4-dihydroxy-2-naphthoate octaprenyltransferase
MNMKLGSFLKLVEIQTKVASVIPYLLGTLYTVFRFDSFVPKNALLMLLSLLCIDMATTAINNYQDYKNANKRHGFGYESHNAIVRDQLSERSVQVAIGILLAGAGVFGFILFLNTDLIVLILGMLSFLLAILYSYGPMPISRTPFGELFSGGFMGFIIPFLAVYINLHEGSLVSMTVTSSIIQLDINWIELAYLGLLTLPAMAGIANIMMANNICDMEEDLENKRYTLPIVAGKKNALTLYKSLYYLGFAALAALMTLRVLPLIAMIVFIAMIPVLKNIRAFEQKQVKAETFVTAVQNFVLVNAGLALTLVVCILIQKY